LEFGKFGIVPGLEEPIWKEISNLKGKFLTGIWVPKEKGPVPEWKVLPIIGFISGKQLSFGGKDFSRGLRWEREEKSLVNLEPGKGGTFIPSSF